MKIYTFKELPKSDQDKVLSMAENQYRHECKLRGVDFRVYNFNIFIKRNILNNFFIIDENYNILMTNKYCRAAINYK